MFNREVHLVVAVLALTSNTATVTPPASGACVRPELGQQVVVVSGTWAGGHGFVFQPGWDSDGNPVHIVRFDADSFGGGLGAATDCQLRIVR